jgi:hypothetical protein
MPDAPIDADWQGYFTHSHDFDAWVEADTDLTYAEWYASRFERFLALFKYSDMTTYRAALKIAADNGYQLERPQFPSIEVW